MRDFFPLGLVLFGFAAGMLVNFIVDWLYLNRNAISNDCISAIRDAGWFLYLVWPWTIPTCDGRKKIRVMVVNLVFACAAPWLWQLPSTKISFSWGYPLLMYFAIIVIMDLEHRIVLHEVSLFGAIFGAGLGIWRHGWFDTILGAIAGFGLMYVMYKLGEVYLRWESKRRGIEIDEVALGFGDVNIAGVLGLILGWPGVFTSLILGVLSGGIISFLYLVYRKLSGKHRDFEAIPYAPFLIFGAIFLLYFRGFIYSTLLENPVLLSALH
jgi:prepilin signal peptidase PulO-like enzyme (type II secretory pathway)